MSSPDFLRRIGIGCRILRRGQTSGYARAVANRLVDCSMEDRDVDLRKNDAFTHALADLRAAGDGPLADALEAEFPLPPVVFHPKMVVPVGWVEVEGFRMAFGYNVHGIWFVDDWCSAVPNHQWDSVRHWLKENISEGEVSGITTGFRWKLVLQDDLSRRYQENLDARIIDASEVQP